MTHSKPLVSILVCVSPHGYFGPVCVLQPPSVRWWQIWFRPTSLRSSESWGGGGTKGWEEKRTFLYTPPSSSGKGGIIQRVCSRTCVCVCFLPFRRRFPRREFRSAERLGGPVPHGSHLRDRGAAPDDPLQRLPEGRGGGFWDGRYILLH